MCECVVEMTVDSGVHLSIDQLKLKDRIGKSLYLHVDGLHARIGWWRNTNEELKHLAYPNEFKNRNIRTNK